MSRAVIRVHTAPGEEAQVDFGSAGTLRANRDWIDDDERFVVCYGDNLTDFEVGKLVSFHRGRGATIGRRGRIVIVRADILADVATVEPVSDFRLQVGGDIAAVFDREVRDTPSRIELVGGGNGLGWAGVDAARAGAAMIAFG